MKILVTGGSGYIGSLLLPKLLDRNHDIILYDNFSFGVRSILHIAGNQHLSIVEGDVRDGETLAASVKKADLIIHLAAIVGFPACSKDPKAAIDINVGGSRNIVNHLSREQRVIFASTGSTYGKVETVCDENTPIAPLTLYGSTKAEAEKLFIGQGGVALRYATVFGVSPRLRLDLLINDFIYQALHNKQIILFEGSFRRTFLHVLDAVKSILFAMDHYDVMRGQAFNIGDESMNYSKRDIAHLIQDKVKFYLHEAQVGEDLDKRDYEVSYKKVRDIGYRSTITMDEGMNELIRVLRHIKIFNEWRNA